MLQPLALDCQLGVVGGGDKFPGSQKTGKRPIGVYLERWLMQKLLYRDFCNILHNVSCCCCSLSWFTCTSVLGAKKIGGTRVLHLLEISINSFFFSLLPIIFSHFSLSCHSSVHTIFLACVSIILLILSTVLRKEFPLNLLFPLSGRSLIFFFFSLILHLLFLFISLWILPHFLSPFLSFYLAVILISVFPTLLFNNLLHSTRLSIPLRHLLFHTACHARLTENLGNGFPVTVITALDALGESR